MEANKEALVKGASPETDSRQGQVRRGLEELEVSIDKLASIARHLHDQLILVSRPGQELPDSPTSEDESVAIAAHVNVLKGRVDYVARYLADLSERIEL